MVCNLKTGLYNLRSAECLVRPSVVQKFIFVKYYKADGTVNSIDLTTPLTEAKIDLLLQQSDANLRWYPTGEVNTFVTDRADPNMETIDNIPYPISDGLRTMSGEIIGASAELQNRIDGNRNSNLGVYLVDEDNGLTGIVNKDNFLDPIKLENNSFAKVVMTTISSKFKVAINTTWSKSVKDGNIRTLTFFDHQTDLLSKVGLLEVRNRNVSNPSATTSKMSLFIPNGDANGIDYTGLLVADFTMKNETTGLAVIISAVAEIPDGTYKLTHLAQTTGDLGSVTISKSGFDFDVVNVVFA